MSYDPGRCFWCENMQCNNCNGINEWRNPFASASIGQPCKCSGHHPKAEAAAAVSGGQR